MNGTKPRTNKHWTFKVFSNSAKCLPIFIDEYKRISTKRTLTHLCPCNVLHKNRGKKNEPTENFLSSIHYIYAFKESQHYVLWYRRRLQTITFEYFSSILKHVCSFNACSLVYVFNVWFLFKNVSHFNGVKEHFLTTKYLRVLLTELRCFVVV